MQMPTCSLEAAGLILVALVSNAVTHQHLLLALPGVDQNAQAHSVQSSQKQTIKDVSTTARKATGAISRVAHQGRVAAAKRGTKISQQVNSTSNDLVPRY